MGNLNSQFRSLELHLAIMDDGDSRGVPFSNKDRQTLLSRGKSEGSSFVYVTLPKFGRAVDAGLVSGTFDCPAGFSLQKGTRIPKFLNLALRQVFSDDGVLLENPNIVTIFYLRQLLLVNSKVVKDPDESQKRIAVEGFADRQRVLRQVVIPKDHPVLNIAQAMLKKVLARLDLSEILPGHGPGIVHEGRERDEKWDFTYWPSQANKVYPFYEYGVQSLEHLRTKSNRICFLDKMQTKVCLVPKDFRGPRLISAEMSAMQYLQQGQMRSMMDYIDNHRILRLSIRMTDQSINQIAAKDAYENRHVTLDLSDASDTVSLPLVWFLLKGAPHVRKYLCRTRAHSALYEGTEIRISAFAPMGSAVCFPVETLVFWAITMASLHLHRYGRRLPTTRTMSELGTEVRVFGDDIVVPENCLDTLVSTLQSVGCRPNMSKTCWATPFRESCGTEWFRGTPVSITRNKRYIYDSHDKLVHYPVLVDLQRRFYVGGLLHTARLVASWAREIAPTGAILVRPEPGAIPTYSWQVLTLEALSQRLVVGSFESKDLIRSYDKILRSETFLLFGPENVLEHSLPLRWNTQLQRVEARFPVFYQRNRKWSAEGYERLLARLLSDSSERVASRDLLIRNAWRVIPSGPWAVRLKVTGD